MTSSNRLGRGVLEPKDCSGRPSAMAAPTFGYPRFREKPADGDGWINGAFFVLEPGVLEYIDGDSTSWERRSMEQLAANRQLTAFRHNSFWQCMDTLREKRLLDELWTQGEAPWKTWE